MLHSIGRALVSLLLIASVVAPRAPAQVATLASVDSSGNQGDGRSLQAAVARDGRFIAFESAADDLVIGDANHHVDVFVRDTKNGATALASVDSSGVQGNGDSEQAALTPDGRFVAFASQASNLVASDTNFNEDVFVHDRATGTTERVSVDSSGAEGNGSSQHPAISSDGNFVAFISDSTNLVAGGTAWRRHVYIRDRASGTTELASVDSSGTEADGESDECAISADGHFVAFSSDATNLVANDTNGSTDVFRRDRQAKTTMRCSLDSAGNQGDGQSFAPAVSADGNRVAFQSSSSSFELVAGTGDQIYVRDVVAGTLTEVSVDSSGTQANEECDVPAISESGRFVAFSTWASNLVSDPNVIGTNVVLHDLVTGRTTWCSASLSHHDGDGDSGDPDDGERIAISPDGARVAFCSSSDDLVANDKNQQPDVFVNGAPLTLTADPESAAAGVTMNFDAWWTQPNSVVLLYAIEIDEVAKAILVGGGTADASGEWTLSAVVPFGLTGHRVMLMAISLLPSGKPGLSNGKIVTFL